MLSLIREDRYRHCWSPLLAISISSDLSVLPSPGRAQCTLTEGIHPSLSPRPSILKTLYPPCATVQLWKPFNCVPWSKQELRPAALPRFLASCVLVFALVQKYRSKHPHWKASLDIAGLDSSSIVLVRRRWHTGIRPIVGLGGDVAAWTHHGHGFAEGPVLHLQL